MDPFIERRRIEEVTGALRWAVPPNTTTKPAVLQQEVVVRDIGDGHVIRQFTEWRNIPTVVVSEWRLTQAAEKATPTEVRGEERS